MKQKELDKILELHKKWLNDEDGGTRADFGHTDLKHANLSYTNLRAASLRFADLEGANLTGANLSCADLEEASLTGADLEGADLRDALLENADLRNANLQNTLLSIPVFEELAETPKTSSHRELDAEVAVKIFGATNVEKTHLGDIGMCVNGEWSFLPEFTKSMDAAMTILERLLYFKMTLTSDVYLNEVHWDCIVSVYPNKTSSSSMEKTGELAIVKAALNMVNYE